MIRALFYAFVIAISGKWLRLQEWAIQRYIHLCDDNPALAQRLNEIVDDYHRKQGR